MAAIKTGAKPALRKGGDWKSRQLQKKNRGNQSTGRSKGIKPSPLARYMCRRNRSWKHPQYNTIMESLGARSKSKSI